MKYLSRILFLVLVTLGFSTVADAQEKEGSGRFWIGLQAGSGGVGAELAATLGYGFEIRAGYAYLPPVSLSRTVNVPEHPGAVGTARGKDVPVDAKATANISDLELLLDYYPIQDNGFHLTAGLLYGPRDIVRIKNMTPLPDDYNIVGLDVDGYTVRAVSNNINGYIAVNSLRPYFGLGYSLSVGVDHRFRFAVDLGAMYWGKPGLYAPGEPLIGDLVDVRVSSSSLNGHDNGLISKAEKVVLYPLLGVHFYYNLF